DMADIPKAMALPVAGLFLGLVIAVFVSYRKPRDYRMVEAATTIEETPKRTASVKDIIVTVIALIAALFAQIQSDSMIIGALAGILILYIFGAMKWKEADDV